MKVTYSPNAFAALQEIHAYINEHNPRAAANVIAAIERQCVQIGQFPGLGRATGFHDIRVIPLSRYPYLIFYKILAELDEVRVLRVRHGARKPIEAGDFEDQRVEPEL